MIEPQPFSKPKREIEQIIESAKALGVEMDQEEAIQWLTAIAAMDQESQDLKVDKQSGVFGHRVVLLDFDPADLDRIRQVATIVEIEDRPNREPSRPATCLTSPGKILRGRSIHWMALSIPIIRKSIWMQSPFHPLVRSRGRLNRTLSVNMWPASRKKFANILVASRRTTVKRPSVCTMFFA